MRPKMGNTIKISISVCMVMAVIIVNLMCGRGHGQTGGIKMGWGTNRQEYNWAGKRSQPGYNPVPDVSEYEKLKGKPSSPPN